MLYKEILSYCSYMTITQRKAQGVCGGLSLIIFAAFLWSLVFIVVATKIPQSFEEILKNNGKTGHRMGIDTLT